MKKSVVLLSVLVMLMCSGCTSVNFTKGDVTVSYTRFLTNVDRIEAQVGGNKILVGGSNVNVEALTSLLQAAK
jgi:uncharacterized protein YceK